MSLLGFQDGRCAAGEASYFVSVGGAGPLGEGCSKREMVGELVELMASLGHRRFAVVGHDRGGRVAFRPSIIPSA